MASTVFPAAGGGGIKLVQRGQATSSGNTTITAIDTTKAFIRSFSEGASGTVACNSSVNAKGLSLNGWKYASSTDGSNGSPSGQTWNISEAMTGGTMDATTKQMGAYIVNSTTITATGACRWEVVEFA